MSCVVWCNLSYVTETIVQTDGARGDLDRAARLAVAGELVAAITHDLRQPLTAIEMNLAAALRQLERPVGESALDLNATRIADAIAALRDALAEQHRMGEALQVLQDLAARREPSFKPLDLATSVREVVHLMSGDALTRHVHIDVRCPEDVPAIFADATLVRQALLNLLIEALESTSTAATGGGQIVVDVRSFQHSAVDVVVTHSGARREPSMADGSGARSRPLRRRGARRIARR